MVLLHDGLAGAFADAIGLRVAHFGLGMLDIIQGQIQLVAMRFRLAAIRCASIRTASTSSLSRSAGVIGILVVHSLAAAHLE